MKNNIDQGYLLLGCQYIRKQLDALAQHTPGARMAAHVEDVHQARVASRRLRAALGMFGECFPAKQSRRWCNQIRKLTQGLGPARDLDVQILSLDKALAELDAADRRYRPGIQRLKLRLSQTRDTLQPRVVKVIDKLDKSQVLPEMVGKIARRLFLLKSQAVTTTSTVAQSRCRDHIRGCVSNLFDWENSLTDPVDEDGHHELRIAAKKLRYTLEIANPSFGKHLSKIIKKVKHSQTLLGDMHDCDVWVDQIEVFARQERERTAAYYGHDRPYRALSIGLIHLRDTRRTLRQQYFTDVKSFWEEQKQKGLWDRLDAIMCGQPSAPKPSGNHPVAHEEDTGNELSQAPSVNPDRPAG